jgi:hypothetical protein
VSMRIVRTGWAELPGNIGSPHCATTQVRANFLPYHLRPTVRSCIPADSRLVETESADDGEHNGRQSLS